MLGRTRKKKSTRCARKSTPTFKFGGKLLDSTHLKTSLGRTGLGRLLGGGGLTALSSLTSFASFAGLWVGNVRDRDRERVGLGQS